VRTYISGAASDEPSHDLSLAEISLNPSRIAGMKQYVAEVLLL
jgi:hypothetical protein